MTTMDLSSVGDVIATREFTLDGKAKVTVLIGKPQQLPGDADWFCPHQKIGMESNRVKCAYGVDSMDALLSALSMVGIELYASAEYEAGRLGWECGAVKGDLGMPVPSSVRDVMPPGASGY